MPWIDAKSKRPPEGQKVIAWGDPGGGLTWKEDDKHIIFDMVKEKKWVSGWDIRWWMPLPPNPEGETGRA